MNKQTKQYLIMSGIAALIASAVVYASNNVEVFEDTIG
jgi:hypothetical protein